MAVTGWEGRQCFFDRSGRAWEDVESISLHKTGKVTGSLGFTGASLDLALERCMGVYSGKSYSVTHSQ